MVPGGPGLPHCCSPARVPPWLGLLCPSTYLAYLADLVTATSSSPPNITSHSLPYCPIGSGCHSSQLVSARDLPSFAPTPALAAQPNLTSSPTTDEPTQTRTITNIVFRPAARPNRPARLDSARPELPQLQSKLQPCSAQQLRAPTMRPSVREIEPTARWAVRTARTYHR